MKNNENNPASTAKKNRVYGSNMSESGNNLLHRTISEAPKNEQTIRGVRVYPEILVALERYHSKDDIRSAVSAGYLVVA